MEAVQMVKGVEEAENQLSYLRSSSAVQCQLKRTPTAPGLEVRSVDAVCGGGSPRPTPPKSQ
ncbi:uncharacterized protein N7482_006965 [Penicillium canariense]|uniref:Uncharacterized protein n=1 Tax=Penicillium canariense TaxID=189055 RepID=A0A9W9LK51_9EURO|nr:uncharacterized protein N7482_006965 [Penicillium canariense]KAJ5159961.1 hypothetical protein N7482_006965 [Penicillium canariense]